MDRINSVYYLFGGRGQRMTTQYYYVTRSPGRDFVAMLTLSEIRARLGAGELQESFYATESDGRSFTQFQRGSGSGRWRTLAELLTEPPRVAAPTPPGPSRWLSAYFLGGGISWLLLAVGQVVAVISCIAIPFGVLYQLGLLGEARQVVDRAARSGDPRAGPAAGGVALAQVVVVVAGILAFCLNAAMFVVFKRANTLAQIAADQDAENQQLWRAIASLPSSRAEPDAAADGGRDAGSS